VESRTKEALADVAPGKNVFGREKVLESITKADFLDYCDTSIAKKVQIGASVWTAQLPSPHEDRTLATMISQESKEEGMKQLPNMRSSG
jgi:hypothetical protein